MADQDTRPESKLARYARGRADLKRVRVPGTDLECLLRVAAVGEYDAALAAAAERWRSLGLDPLAFPQQFQESLVVEVLALVLRDADVPDGSKPFALDARDLYENLTAPQRAALFFEYEAHQDATAPELETLTDREIDAIRDAVKKKDWTRLNGFGSARLSAYMRIMASEPGS